MPHTHALHVQSLMLMQLYNTCCSVCRLPIAGLILSVCCCRCDNIAGSCTWGKVPGDLDKRHCWKVSFTAEELKSLAIHAAGRIATLSFGPMPLMGMKPWDSIAYPAGTALVPPGSRPRAAGGGGRARQPRSASDRLQQIWRLTTDSTCTSEQLNTILRGILANKVSNLRASFYTRCIGCLHTVCIHNVVNHLLRYPIPVSVLNRIIPQARFPSQRTQSSKRWRYVGATQKPWSRMPAHLTSMRLAPLSLPCTR